MFMKIKAYTHRGPRKLGFEVMLLALIVTVLAVGPRSVLAQPTATGAWEKLPDMPVPRWEAATVVLDDKLYVFGGYAKPTKSVKRVDVFDPKDGSWRKLADLPSAITHMNAVLDGRSVWIAGGFKDGYKGYAINEVWRYDVDKNTFTAAPSLPKPRAGGGLALLGRHLHYVGGLLPDRLTDSADHWVLDLNAVAGGAGTWKDAAALPSPRNQFGTVTYRGKMRVLGGQFGHDRGQNDQARVDVYDPETDTWKRGHDLPKPHSHAEGSTFVSHGQVFMMGGMTREGSKRRIDAAIWACAANGEWKVLGKLPRKLSSPAAAIIGERLFVAGGSLNGAHPQPEMWVRTWKASAVADAYWPSMLGPKRDGWVSGFRPPARWPEKLERRWRVKVGVGYGSPLVAGGRVFQHARQGDDEVLWCFDLETGDMKWRKSHSTPFKIAGGGERHGKGPKSSPVLADGRVFTMSITGILTARDAGSGDLLWRRDYSARFKKGHPNWGAATSPLVDGDRIVVHFGNDEVGVLMALDVKTGKVLWSQGKDGPSYSSPLVAEIQGVRQIVEWNHESLVGVESDSGRLLWEFPFPHLTHNQNMPTPAFHEGRILLGGENRGILGLDPILKDGVWSVKTRWHQKEVALDMSSAVVNGDFLYGLSHYDKGRFFCLDVKTGNVLWKGPGRTGNNVAFLAIPGHVVALINDGELQIIAASGERFEKVASYQVAESPTWAPPVLLENGLLVKDNDSLTLWSLTGSTARSPSSSR
jgi:outer membrane protein assembly factor BamB